MVYYKRMSEASDHFPADEEEANVSEKKTFYITTPIYYPSGKLHIGNSIRRLPAMMQFLVTNA